MFCTEMMAFLYFIHKCWHFVSFVQKYRDSVLFERVTQKCILMYFIQKCWLSLQRMSILKEKSTAVRSVILVSMLQCSAFITHLIITSI